MSKDKSSLSLPEIVEEIKSLHHRAVREYAPIVKSILESHSQDAGHIEHTLDGLLDFSGSEQGEILFKQLCRYYETLSPDAAASYFEVFRELWESEHGEEQV